MTVASGAGGTGDTGGDSAVMSRAASTPIRRVSGKWITLFALAWLGLWMAQLTPFQLTLPQQINAWLGLPTDATKVAESDWQHSVTAFGEISGISAVCAFVTFPLVGSLSDRTRSRYGRRRPWIMGGTLLMALALVVLGFQHTWAGMAICWALVITGFSAAATALTALISDQVPVFQRGVVSSWVSAPQAIGLLFGVAVIGGLAGTHYLPAYLVLAIAVVVLVWPFVLLVDDPQHATHTKGRLTLRTFISEMWISPREQPDFGWTLLGRVLVNIGNALGTALLLQFIQFGARLDDPATKLTIGSGVYMILVLVGSLATGRFSDRIGRRKPFVFAAGIAQGIAAIVIVVSSGFGPLLVAAGLLGLGYGCFLGVDQALATEVLPDAEHNGQDLGIMNIAMQVPQALGPLIGAGIVAATGGFTWVYIASAIFGIAGGLAVLPVKRVR